VLIGLLNVLIIYGALGLGMHLLSIVLTLLGNMCMRLFALFNCRRNTKWIGKLLRKSQRFQVTLVKTSSDYAIVNASVC